ncbi:peptidylprolyl isomerase [Rubripirellula reticaptiva]|uniref:peptidylprolyl isomerase n=1 Tax=Rubripirellula reticaptiva TaxID=2528013 RepID=UPI001646DF2B|nr:peptidylprolyl isomerase [Rubripirellula reticaptiva]
MRRHLRLENLEARRLLAGDWDLPPALASDVWAASRIVAKAEGETTDAPSFQLIADQTVEMGSPLHIPIDAAGASGGPLTTTVTVSNPALVEAVVISGNRSIRVDVENFGEMVFELFEQRAPRASGRVIELAEAGFYDGILFHRVIDGFVLQAGDPTATGTSGSDLADFDDEFHPDLQHNREGILSFAKTSDDTNNSQFFVTATDTRHLDFNHSIFGQLVEGFDVRKAISKTPVDSVTSKPLTDVVIRTIDVFDDVENSVVMLRALAADVQVDVTVQVTDQDGNSVSQTFVVSTVADAVNANPFLKPIPPQVLASSNETYSLTLEAIDLESDAVAFAGQYSSDSFGSTASLDPVTGIFEITPAAGFTGTIDFLFGVTSAVANNLPYDIQAFQLQFIDSLLVPSSPVLESVNHQALTTTVSEATAGALIELVDSNTGEVLATTSADSGVVVVTWDFPESLQSGEYSLVARSRVGSLVSGSSSALVVNIDRTAPMIDTVALPTHGFAGEPIAAAMAADEVISRWSIVDGPELMTIDPAAGLLQWTPPSSVRGVQSFTVVGEDVAGNSAAIELTVQITSRYVNPANPYDVDGNGAVSGLDALLVINALSRGGGTIGLPEYDLNSPSGLSSLRQDYYYNANQDVAITALDALVVINEIGRQQVSGEGEAAAERRLGLIDAAIWSISIGGPHGWDSLGSTMAEDRDFDGLPGQLF